MPVSCVHTILEHHPELYLIISHACFPDLMAAFEMARKYTGVYIDLTNVPGSIPYFQDEFEGHNLTKILINGIHEFSGRVFFGTDHPVGMGSVDEIFKQFGDLNLDPDINEMLMYKSASQFLEKFKW